MRWRVGSSSRGTASFSTSCARVPGTSTSTSSRSRGSTCGPPSVSEVNLDRLRELAGQLLGAVRELRELGRAPREVFLADSRTVNSAKYLLIVATEAALDICNHLAARRGGRSPRDYADCIAVLQEIGAVDSARGWRGWRASAISSSICTGGWRTPRSIA